MIVNYVLSAEPDRTNIWVDIIDGAIIKVDKYSLGKAILIITPEQYTTLINNQMVREKKKDIEDQNGAS